MTFSAEVTPTSAGSAPRVSARLGAPRLSVIVASNGDRADLDRCLLAFRPECERLHCELIVVRSERTDPSTRLYRLERDYPNVRFASAAAGTSLAQLRNTGVLVATGDVLLLVDDRIPPNANALASLDRSGGVKPETQPVTEAEMAMLAVSGDRSAPDDVSPTGSRAVRLMLRHDSVGPLVSVIVTAHFGAQVLAECLSALESSDLPRTSWEVIVVDDTGNTSMLRVAAQYADKIVRLPSPLHGPAYARNRGAEAATAPIVVFVNADVRVHESALGQMISSIAGRGSTAAVVGCYDGQPVDNGLVSLYWSLHLRYLQVRRTTGGEEFWSGCAAVRRSVFEEAGGFDEWRFPRPLVDDVEFGHRLRGSGQTIIVSPTVQVTSMRRWTLRSLMLSEFRDHHMLRARIGLAADKVTGIHLESPERTNALLTWLAILLACLELVWHNGAPLVGAGACILSMLIVGRARYRYFVRQGGWLFTFGAVVLDVINNVALGLGMAIGRTLRHLVGDPARSPTLEAFSEVGVQTWPPVPRKPQA